MSESAAAIAKRVSQLRHDFDRSFADPPEASSQASEAFLAIRLDSQPYALRLSDVAGLYSGKTITRLCGSHHCLRGIAAFRGLILPIYDLAALLGRSGCDRPRWIVIANAAPVGLAFETFECQLRVGANAIVSQDSQRAGFTRDHVTTGDLVRPILDPHCVLDAIKR